MAGSPSGVPAARLPPPRRRPHGRGLADRRGMGVGGRRRLLRLGGLPADGPAFGNLAERRRQLPDRDRPDVTPVPGVPEPGQRDTGVRCALARAGEPLLRRAPSPGVAGDVAEGLNRGRRPARRRARAAHSQGLRSWGLRSWVLEPPAAGAGPWPRHGGVASDVVSRARRSSSPTSAAPWGTLRTPPAPLSSFDAGPVLPPVCGSPGTVRGLGRTRR